MHGDSRPRPSVDPWRLVRGMAAMLLGLAGAAVFVNVMNRTLPVGDWLSGSILPLWGWALLWSGACFGFGQFVLVHLLKLPYLPVLESAVLSMALGVVGFGLAMYVGGWLGLFTPAFAVLLPILMLALGTRDGYKLLVRWRHEFLNGRLTALYCAAIALGLTGTGLVYLALLTPDAVNYDAAWYHLRMAQDYARWGRIQPFYDYNACVPHLASLLYTWGYLVPWISGAQRWMMALHLEFVLFLWTLAGVAAGAQRLLENFQIRGTWAVFFLFPVIFVYDNNLGAAADHALAFFSIPLLLATLHVLRGFTKSRCAMLAITLAGALLTKYQAVYLIAPVAIVVAVAWLGEWVRLRRIVHEPTRSVYTGNLKLAPVIVLGLGALCVSPHFVGNYVFYRNPVYPFMLDFFKQTQPTVPNASAYVNYMFTDPSWIPNGTLGSKFKHALELFFTFSFKPHYSCINYVPVFGSLFTLLLPGLFLVRPRKSVFVASAIAAAAILAWGMTYNVDRNLQIVLPVMVCVTATLLVQLWQLGWVARVGLAPLVLVQAIWGTDAPFLPANGSYCSGSDRIMSSIALIRSGYEGRAKTRFNGYFGNFVAIGKALPHDARLLLHASHTSLGIDRDTLQDMAGFQGLIDYSRARSPRELYDYFRSLGITHVLDGPGHGEATRQEQAIYYALLKKYGVSVNNGGG